MRKPLLNVLIIVAVSAVVYFGNKTVQSYLGEAAVNDLSFPIHSLEKAREIAQRDGKLVLADYSAIWCPSCRKLDTQVFANIDVAKTINDNFVYTRLDYDSEEGANFAKTYDLVGFPRVLVLDTKGNKLTEMPLTFEASEYKNNLSKVSQQLSQILTQ